MPSRLYLGPYNDPTVPNGAKHWDSPHDPDFANPALIVTHVGNSYNVYVVVRSRDTINESPSDVTVELYAMRPPNNAPDPFTRTDVRGWADGLLNGTIANVIQAGNNSVTVGNSQVPAFSPCFDRNWTAGPIKFIFRAARVKTAIIVAKLTSNTWALGPTGHADVDPCVAIWVGP